MKIQCERGSAERLGEARLGHTSRRRADDTIVSGANEATLVVPAEAATNWIAGPPMLVIHEEGQRWPAVALVTAGHDPSELRASFVLGPREAALRVPVVVTNAAAGEVTPVLFLRCDRARVEVVLNGRATGATAQSLSMYVRALESRRRVSGANTLTLRHTAFGDDDEAPDEDGDGVPDVREPPMVEALLVVGDRSYPARAPARTDEADLSIAFAAP